MIFMPMMILLTATACLQGTETGYSDQVHREQCDAGLCMSGMRKTYKMSVWGNECHIFWPFIRRVLQIINKLNKLSLFSYINMFNPDKNSSIVTITYPQFTGASLQLTADLFSSIQGSVVVFIWPVCVQFPFYSANVFQLCRTHWNTVSLFSVCFFCLFFFKQIRMIWIY